MNIHDLAETWFSEYQTIADKVKSPTATNKLYKIKKKALKLKGKKLNEHAYLWGQNNKKTMSEVCEMFNLKAGSLRSWIRDNNLIKLLADGRAKNIGKAQFHRSREEVKALCEQAYDKMKNQGWSQTKVCKEYKLSNITIQKYINKLNEKS
jgi:hypothetical protein